MTIVIYLVLTIILIIFFIFIFRLYSKIKQERTQEFKYSEVNGKISEVKTRLNIVRKKAPKGIKVDLNENEKR